MGEIATLLDVPIWVEIMKQKRLLEEKGDKLLNIIF
jgi:hypothetical protein